MTSKLNLRMEKWRNNSFSLSDIPSAFRPSTNLSRAPSVTSVFKSPANRRMMQIQQKKQVIVSDLAAFEENQDCICNRRMCRLTCRQCKSNYYGRLHKICSVHPNTCNLYDYSACGSCKGRLTEISDAEYKQLIQRSVSSRK